MKAARLIRNILQIPAEHPTCPLTGTACDAPHLRAALGIGNCERQTECPMGKHRKIIPLIQLYDLEQKRSAWRQQPA
jgi:hypothetical protein